MVVEGWSSLGFSFLVPSLALFQVCYPFSNLREKLEVEEGRILDFSSQTSIAITFCEGRALPILYFCFMYVLDCVCLCVGSFLGWILFCGLSWVGFLLIFYFG